MSVGEDPLPKPLAPSTGSGLDATIVQSGEALAQAKDLSIPSDVTQAQEAPKVPGYVLTALIGQGSFAQVWKAWQVRTRKIVALKVFTSRSGVNWVFLQREMERLARIDKHPHVVSLLDADLAGQTAWYATELLEGGSLEKFMNPASPVTPARVAAWMEEIAAALSFVHGKGIIHCDLKPGNVLLDESGHVRVADFGQARVMGEGSGGLGTLFYMPPEQAVLPREGEAQVQPDVRWDVYGLGATAYALLTGTAPHAGTMTEALARTATVADRLEVYRMRVKATPLTLSPSPRFGALSASKGRGEGRVRGEARGLDRDLAAIVAKCLAAEPAERYANADAVLSDLTARRERRPVSPLRGSRRYRVTKFLQRNAAAAVVGTAAALGLVVAGIELARKNIALSEQVAGSLLQRAKAQVRLQDFSGAAACYAALNRVSPSRVARSNALGFLSVLGRPEDVIDHPPGRYAIDPAGRLFAVAAPDGALLVWDVVSGRRIISMRHAKGGTLVNVVFSPDGTLLASAGDGEDRTVRVWNARTGEAVGSPLLHDGKINALAFSEDGRRLATGSDDLMARMWDVARSRMITGPLRHKNAVGNVFLSQDGKRLITTSWAQGAFEYSCWDTLTGSAVGRPVWIGGLAARCVFVRGGFALVSTETKAILVSMGTGRIACEILPEGENISSIAVSPDGRRCLVGHDGGTVALWTIPGGQGLARARFHDNHAVVAWSPDGSRTLSFSLDGTARVWDGWTLSPVGNAMRPGAAVLDGAFLPDGRRVVLGTADGRALTYDLQGRVDGLIRPHVGADVKLFVLADPRRLVTMTANTLSVWTMDGGESERAGRGIGLLPEGMAANLTFAVVGAGAVSAPSYDAHILHWKGGRLGLSGRIIGISEGMSAFATSGDGGVGAGVGWSGTVTAWDLRTGKAAGRPILPSGPPFSSVAISPDGNRVATSDGRFVRQWDPQTGVEVGGTLDMKLGVSTLAYSGDGRRLVVNDGPSLRVWDTVGFRPAGPPIDAPFRWGAALNRDGSLVATGSTAGLVHIWSVRTGQPAGPVMRHRLWVSAVAFSPDGELLLTGSWDQTAQLWDVRTSEPVGPPMVFSGGVTAVGFMDGGRTACAVSWSPEPVRAWDIGWAYDGASAREVEDRVALIARRRLGPDGNIEPIPLDAWRALAARDAAKGGRP